MLNKIKRQLLSFEASILKYIYSGGGYWLINLDFSSTHLVLLLVSRCCFSSVVSCQSHRKKFFFWTESWIWDFYRSQYRPSLKTVDSVALLLSCASWCPRENRIFIFSSAYSLFILFFVCVCVAMFWITFSMSSEVSSPFQETQYSFSRKVPAVIFHFAYFYPIAVHSILWFNMNYYFGYLMNQMFVLLSFNRNII